jgi:Tol biopolymer transport system component
LRQTGRPQIYLLNIDDGEIFPLATEASKNMQPAWSPDGKQIIYVSTQEFGERLWIMEVNGENKQPISDPEIIASYPDWSSTGDHIVYTSRLNIGNLPNLERGSLIEFEPTQIVEDNVPRRDADISPDGNWLVLESWPDGTSHDIWIMSVDGEETRVLVDFPFYEFNPVWRPLVTAP